MKKVIVTLVSLFTLLFMAGCATEGTVSGQITSESGAAIEMAAVSIESSTGTFDTTTDAEGNYEVTELPVNETLQVLVSKEGYISHSGEVSLSKEAANATYDAALTPEVVSVATGTVNGTIFNAAGDVLSGVRVFNGSTETLTDENGHYTLTLEASQSVSITAELTNYAQNSRNVAVEEDSNATLDLTLVVVDVIETFEASEGAELSTKGATISLPTAYKNADGSDYTGTVKAKVSFNRVTTVQGEAAFPGDYLGLETDGSETVLQSYGFIDVTLEDENGNPLQLADGATATLTYPMDSNIDETPVNIPLWYYDIERGVWVEDGVAIYDAVTNSYSGEVTHFTTWNLDKKFDGASLTTCIVDINNLPVQEADLYISGAGWNKHVTNRDSNGQFTLINAPSNLPITIYSRLTTSVSETKTYTLSPGEARNDSDCLVINTDLSELYTRVTGQLTDGDGNPMEEISITIQTDNSLSTVTDLNGSFMSELFLKPANNKVDITFYINQDDENVKITKTFILSDLSNTTDIGTIELKTTKVLACLVDENGALFEYTGERGGNIIIDTPYISSNDYDKLYESGSGNFELYLPRDSKTHTIYAYDDFEDASASQDFVANTTLVDLRSNCLQLAPITPANVTTTVEIVDFASKDVTLEIKHGTQDIRDTYGFPYFNGKSIATDVNSTTFSTLEDGNYLVKLRLPYDAALDFSGVKVHVTVEGQLDTVITVPDGLESDLWGGDWYFFKIEVFQGKATIKIVNEVGNVPV